MKQKKVFQSISNEIKGSGIWSLGWTPLQGLGLISPGEFWLTGPCSGPPCSANARHTLFIPWLHTYTLCQCSWTKSHLQQGWQGGAGGKFGLAQTSVFALSRLKACSSFHLRRKEGLCSILVVSRPFAARTLHFQAIPSPGPVCLHVADAGISSWLHFETSAHSLLIHLMFIRFIFIVS